MTAQPPHRAPASGAVVAAWEPRRDAQQVLYAQRALLGRAVVAVCPIDPHPFRHTPRPRRGLMDELISRQRELAAAHALETWSDRLRAEGVDVESVVRRGDAVEVLVSEALEHAAGAIAIAVRPPPAVFGGAVARLIRRAPGPALLLREPRRPGGAVDRVVVPLTASAPASSVVRVAAGVAAAHDAEVVLVVTGDPFAPAVRAALEEAERHLATVRIRFAGEVALRPLCSLLEEEEPDLIAVAGPTAPSVADAADRMLVHLLLESSSSLLVVQEPARAPTAERPTCRRVRLSSARTRGREEAVR